MAQAEKPHAVCIPFPAQSHINAMLKLAKLLLYKGFHITFVNTEFNHTRILKSRGPNSLDGLSSFQFQTIPDGLPPSDSNADASQDIRSLMVSIRKNFLNPFRQLLFKLNNNDTAASSNVPSVSCIVSDTMMPFTLKAAEELGIPCAFYCPVGAGALMGCAQLRNLVDKGFSPLKDVSYLTNGYLDTIINWIPGMKGIRLKDIPSLIRTTDPDDIMLNYIMSDIEAMRDSSAIILNTFDGLEHEVLEALGSMFPPIYTIGPLQLLLNQIPTENGFNEIGSNLWKEERGCLDWLDSKEPNSVIYVNFGSLVVLTAQQLIEFSWGLFNSMQNFLWIIRPNLGPDSVVLPSNFLAETKDRGLLASWCPQEQVLRHSAIGGFLTHSGWNSTLDSVCGGVPMICCPFGGDQTTNCWYCCTHWGIGMEIVSEIKREKVESLVRELMEGEKGKEMKKKAMEWKVMAAEATSPPNGSSYLNFEKMVTQVLLAKRSD